MVDASFSWGPDEVLRVASADDLNVALAKAEAVADEPLIVSLKVGGSTLMHVVGDPSGSTLVFFPSGFPDSGASSMHSVGDRAMRDAGISAPLQGAYVTGEYSELPRWMVVPVHVAEEALREFLATDGALPSGIDWEED